jgi:hypothetical protein
MAILKFEVNDRLKKIVEFTMARKEFEGAYGSKPPKEPSLFLVHDDGIYVMPATKDRLYDMDCPATAATLKEIEGLVGEERKKAMEGKKARSLVAYAKGFDPNKDEDVWEAARDAVGGDDFAENIPCAPFAEAIKQNRPLVKVKLTSKSIAFAF